MKNIFSQLENDTVIIISKDGLTVSREIRASVSSNQITTFETDIDINEGDFVERTLPNNKIERYLIHEANYSPGFHQIPANYQLKISKVNAIPKASSVSHTTYNLHGNNSRVYSQSIDNSVNIVNDGSEKLFDELRKVISEQIKDDKLLAIVDEMEQSKGTTTFVQKYNSFIQNAANHITVITPFIPQLSALLIGHS